MIPWNNFNRNCSTTQSVRDVIWFHNKQCTATTPRNGSPIGGDGKNVGRSIGIGTKCFVCHSAYTRRRRRRRRRATIYRLDAIRPRYASTACRIEIESGKIEHLNCNRLLLVHIHTRTAHEMHFKNWRFEHWVRRANVEMRRKNKTKHFHFESLQIVGKTIIAYVRCIRLWSVDFVWHKNNMAKERRDEALSLSPSNGIILIYCMCAVCWAELLIFASRSVIEEKKYRSFARISFSMMRSSNT